MGKNKTEGAVKQGWFYRFLSALERACNKLPPPDQFPLKVHVFIVCFQKKMYKQTERTWVLIPLPARYLLIQLNKPLRHLRTPCGTAHTVQPGRTGFCPLLLL